MRRARGPDSDGHPYARARGTDQEAPAEPRRLQPSANVGGSRWASVYPTCAFFVWPLVGPSVPARPGSAFQQSAVSGLLPRARARREIPDPSSRLTVVEVYVVREP